MSNIGDTKKSTGCWWVYVVRCIDSSLYTGITTDILRRIDQHNGTLPGGAKYTRPRRPVVLIAKESVSDRSTALKLEARIKKMTRDNKLLWCLAHKHEAHEENH